MTPTQIKALRKKLKMNTTEFGELFPMSPRSIENWEQGLRSPSKPCIRIMEKIKEGL